MKGVGAVTFGLSSVVNTGGESCPQHRDKLAPATQKKPLHALHSVVVQSSIIGRFWSLPGPIE